MQNRILSRHLGRTFHSKVPGWKDSILAPWSENNSLVLEQITGTHSSLPMSKRMRSRCQDECEADVNMMRSLCQGKCEADVKPNAKPTSGRPRSLCREGIHKWKHAVCEAYVKKNAKPIPVLFCEADAKTNATPMPHVPTQLAWDTFPPNSHGTHSHPTLMGHVPT